MHFLRQHILCLWRKSRLPFGHYIKRKNKEKPMMEDEYYMDAALVKAAEAESAGEVPVGAVIVDENGLIIAGACNRTINMSDPTAHAEILALREAGGRAGNYRLLNMTLYATIEPCAMCMGAAVHARLKRVVFGVADPRWGAAGSLFNFSEKGLFNHFVEITGGVRESECRRMIVDFFRDRRKSGS